MENEENIVEETIVDTDEIVEETNQQINEVVEDAVDEAEDAEGLERDLDNSDELIPTKTFTQEDVDRMIQSRIARVEKKYAPLKNTLKAGGFDSDNVEEIAEQLTNSYLEQGFDVPKFEDVEEEELLGEAKAKKVISIGSEEMKDRFTELWTKREKLLKNGKELSTREFKEMITIGEEHSNKQKEVELIELGLNPKEVQNDIEFMDFVKQFNKDVSIKNIYSLYQKQKGIQKTPPASSGSVKNNTSTQSKFTQNNLDTMSESEMAKYWDDPEFRKIAGLK